MSTSKAIGAGVGAAVGVAVAALGLHSLHTQIDGNARGALLLVSALFCSALGALVGFDDRRR